MCSCLYVLFCCSITKESIVDIEAVVNKAAMKIESCTVQYLELFIEQVRDHLRTTMFEKNHKSHTRGWGWFKPMLNE